MKTVSIKCVIISFVLMWLCGIAIFVSVDYFFHFLKDIKPLQLIAGFGAITIEIIIIVYLFYPCIYHNDHDDVLHELCLGCTIALQVCYMMAASYGLILVFLPEHVGVLARVGGLAIFAIANLIIVSLINCAKTSTAPDHDQPPLGDHNH